MVGMEYWKRKPGLSEGCDIPAASDPASRQPSASAYVVYLRDVPMNCTDVLFCANRFQSPNPNFRQVPQGMPVSSAPWGLDFGFSVGLEAG